MNDIEKVKDRESLVRIKGKQFYLAPNQVVYYDPDGISEFSSYIEMHLDEIKDWFHAIDYEFCYIPDICKHFTNEQILYLFPNWKGDDVALLGNDLLKSWLVKQFSKIGAGFLRLENVLNKTYKHFALASFDTMSWEEQMKLYKPILFERLNEYSLNHDDQIRFSVSADGDNDTLYSVFEKKMSLADKNFSDEEISAEIKQIVEHLHTEGFGEFVLRCMVSVEEKLSRIVITPKYEIVLPDYDNLIIEMSPLPKAVFLLFLIHPEGLYFKELVDYKDELRGIYEKITNRTSSMVIGDSIDKVTDPTDNAINEKCSRIREAFIKHIDKKLAKSYYITGWRSKPKRITLPRNLVEWQCDLAF